MQFNNSVIDIVRQTSAHSQKKIVGNYKQRETGKGLDVYRIKQFLSCKIQLYM